jgi:hypothetical protein
MKRLRAIWILAAVLALGPGYTVLPVRTERGAEIQVLLCLSEQHGEQQFSDPKPPIIWDETANPVSSDYDAPLSNSFVWPSAYKRPPPHSLVQF